MRGLGALLFLLFLGACGRSQVSSSFELAAKKQVALDDMILEIFARSPPADSGNATITAAADLDDINRTELKFSEVKDVKDQISSTSLTIYESPNSASGPTFYDWAGEFIPTTQSAFQSFMSYYHATKAKNFALTLFPSVDFSSSSNTIFPLTIYSKEDGDITATSYDPSEKVIHLMYDSAGPLPAFRVADEADSVYHEFGHVLQDALNPTILDTPVAGLTDLYPFNRDLDSILEGLSDFYAASIARDDAILYYLSANLPSFLDSGSRTGTQYKRSLQNSLAFPDAYVRNAHLDGRVLSSALNDFRKVLSGDTLQVPLGCSSCTSLKLSAALVVDKGAAFDRVATLAYEAYASMNSSVTFFEYSELLRSTCTGGGVQSWCAEAEVAAALDSVLNSRGLRPSSLSVNDATLTIDVEAGGSVESPATTSPGDITVKQIVGRMPFPNDTGFANSDSVVDTCEVYLIFPNIEITNSTESIYDITFSIEGISGFTALVNPGDGQTVESITPGTSAGRKVLGWLKPGETSQNMVDFYVANPSSRWYVEQFGSFFAQKLSADYYPSELGWLVRTPSAVNTTAQIKFRMNFRRYNASTIAKYQTTIFTQTLTTTNNAGFCQ